MSLTLATLLLAGTAYAQSTPPATTTPSPGSTAPTASPGINPSTGTHNNAGMVERNQGTAAASGNNNQAVATTDANAPAPARGANSFTQGQAQSRIQDHGFQNVTGLNKDDDGVWRGTGTKNGQPAAVWLDYKGNVGEGNAPVMHSDSSTTSNDRAAANTTGSGYHPDGTAGNPPGTATTRAADRALNTNMSGAYPQHNNPDGTPGNPPGTAAERATDRTLGTNTSGANPSGNTAR